MIFNTILITSTFHIFLTFFVDEIRQDIEDSITRMNPW